MRVAGFASVGTIVRASGLVGFRGSGFPCFQVWCLGFEGALCG